MAEQGTTDYRFCPICATPLLMQRRHGAVRPVCPACGFVRFPDPKVSVVGFVTRDDELLLIRRRVDPGRGLWALPGGFMDAGEMPAEALQRELHEEVGIQVEPGPLLEIFPLTSPQGDAVGIVLVMAAGAPAGATLTAQDDVDEAAWFARTALPQDLAFVSTRTMVDRWAKGAPLETGVASPHGKER